MSLVNRDPEVFAEVSIDVTGASFDVMSAAVITGDPKAANTWDEPDVIRPIQRRDMT